jgi:hypothetical protein
MDDFGLSRLDLTDEVRVELLRRAVALITEYRDCEPAMNYLRDVERQLEHTPHAGISDLPAPSGIFTS